MKFGEFLKIFLVLRIIFDSIEQVDQSLHPCNTMPPKSIYDAYCLTCQKLAESFKRDFTRLKHHRNHVVGICQFGRLVKLIYPNLQIKRLGRRGHSKYHYLGIGWNNDMVDSDIIQKQVVGVKFQNTFLKNGPMVNFQGQELREGIESGKDQKSGISLEKKETFLLRFNFMAGSLYRFTLLSSTLPEIDCLPRNWECVPGKISENSKWSQNTISRSMLALKKYDVDVMPLIQNFPLLIFLPPGLNFFL